MKRMIAPIGAIALALLVGAGAMWAQAKQPDDEKQDVVAGGKIGSVDMEDVYNASGAPQDLERAAHQHEIEGEQRINKIMAVPYLEQAELEEYGALIGKASLTPDEEKRFAAIKALNDNRAAELAGLVAKPNPAPQDAARITHLNDLKRTLQNELRPQLIADFRAQNDSMMQEYRHRQIAQLRQEVGRVAKDNGLAHVFDSGTLVYTSVDITKDVIQRMANKSKGKR
ncbi:MAG TPA: hypothetical protein VKT77_14220 [Chthonomonadaceae bacterium]|nr:hypothetical protein [Chthonomonadaceae bacterium]